MLHENESYYIPIREVFTSAEDQISPLAFHDQFDYIQQVIGLEIGNEARIYPLTRQVAE